jgi:hypothetical protein
MIYVIANDWDDVVKTTTDAVEAAFYKAFGFLVVPLDC